MTTLLFGVTVCPCTNSAILAFSDLSPRSKMTVRTAIAKSRKRLIQKRIQSLNWTVFNILFDLFLFAPFRSQVNRFSLPRLLVTVALDIRFFAPFDAFLPFSLHKLICLTSVRFVRATLFRPPLVRSIRDFRRLVHRSDFGPSDAATTDGPNADRSVKACLSLVRLETGFEFVCRTISNRTRLLFYLHTINDQLERVESSNKGGRECSCDCSTRNIVTRLFW
jgi:hypothetical protein